MQKKYIRPSGFSLTELLVVVAITGILASVAVPSYNDSVERHRLESASEAILSDIRWARSESIKRNLEVRVTFATGGAWSYSINVDPDNTNTVLKAVNGSDFSATSLPTAPFGVNAYTTFDPVRGTASSGNVNLTSANYSLFVTVSNLGRSRICGGVMGYAAC